MNRFILAQILFLLVGNNFCLAALVVGSALSPNGSPQEDRLYVQKAGELDRERIFIIADGHGGKDESAKLSRYKMPPKKSFKLPQIKSKVPVNSESHSFGAAIAQHVVDLLPKLLREWGVHKDHYLSVAFSEMDDRIFLNTSINSQRSGSTASVLIVLPKGRMRVANIGDSPVIVGSMASDTARLVSTLHEPIEGSKERHRLLKLGALEMSFSNTAQGAKYCGLSVTRSFGDYHLKIDLKKSESKFNQNWVSVEPSIAKISPHKDKFDYVLLASDGLFGSDSLFEEETYNKVHLFIKNWLAERDLNPKNITEIAVNDLCDDLVLVYSTKDRKTGLDNASVIVVFIKPKPKRKRIKTQRFVLPGLKAAKLANTTSYPQSYSERMARLRQLRASDAALNLMVLGHGLPNNPIGK